MRITAGILMIIGGIIGGSLWSGLVGELFSGYARSLTPLSPEDAAQMAVPIGFLSTLICITPMFLAVMGGIYTLKRSHWRWALAGAICSLLFPFTGIPAVILLVKSKSQFSK